ncbi:MAG TPA: hypothetical protein ENI87_02720 [bacterium]|nr:hypothetical protein [bacterium]
MTPVWIRTVAALLCAGALLPAQEKHKIIVRRERVAEAKQKAKEHTHIHAKMMAIIEQLTDEELSAKNRKQAKQALLDLLRRVESGSNHEAYLIVDDKPKKERKRTWTFRVEPTVVETEDGPMVLSEVGECIEGLGAEVGHLDTASADEKGVFAKRMVIDALKKEEEAGLEGAFGVWIAHEHAEHGEPEEECEHCETEEEVGEHCDECDEEEECDACDESEEEEEEEVEETLEELTMMIAEMRAEIRELRAMMREIRAQLRGHGRGGRRGHGVHRRETRFLRLRDAHATPHRDRRAHGVR